MKNKTIVTGLNRKNLRILGLELSEELEKIKLEKLELSEELEKTKLEKITIAKNVAELRTKNNLLAQLHQNAEGELEDVRENLTEFANKYVAMIKDNFNLSQEKAKIEDKLNLAHLTIDLKDKEIVNLESEINILKQENEHFKNEASKTWWKKVFRC